MSQQSTFSIHMDNELKEQFEILCNDFGMSMSTAFTIFAKAVVREQRIPFEISSVKDKEIQDKALMAFYELRKQARIDFPNGMSLEEINEEINNTRNKKEN